MNFLAPRDTVIIVSVEPCPALAELEVWWRDLESRADGSFFTSWTWIGAWLSTCPADLPASNFHILIARAEAAVVGLAVIGERGAQAFLRPGTIAALHQSGQREDDAIFIEYNDFLLDRRCAAQARDAMLAFIGGDKRSWREVRLSGTTPVMYRAVAQLGLRHRVISERLCPWIDLARTPPGLSGYLAVLSRNTRQQIQRSLRLYQAEGEVKVTQACTEADASSMLDELQALHRKSWRERKGHEGAFASARFMCFVRSLVATGIAKGDAQLLRASAGNEPIGYLLNFVHRGHVYAYQSGFAYRDDNRFRPGLTTHALAAVRAREQGLRGYHFMAGDGRYKSSLANADEHLFWMTLRHDDLLSRAEDFAHALKARLRAFIHGRAN